MNICCCSLAGTPACANCPNNLANMAISGPHDYTLPQSPRPYYAPQTLTLWPAHGKVVIEEYDKDGKLVKRTVIDNTDKDKEKCDEA